MTSFRKDDEKLLENYYKIICINIEDLKNIELNALQVYDDTYIQTKILTYSMKVSTNFRGLNVPEGYIESKSFTIISVYSLLVFKNKYCLEVHLDNCAYRIANKQA